MKITITEQYNSVGKGEYESPNLLVLTGLNGSGKTQLLEGIYERKIEVSSGVKKLTRIKYVRAGQLGSNGFEPASRATFTEDIRQAWVYVQQVQQEIQNKTVNPQGARDRLFGVLGSDEVMRERMRIIIDSIGIPVQDLTIDEFYKGFPIYLPVASNEIFIQNLSSVFHRYHLRNDQSKYARYLAEVENSPDSVYVTQGEFERHYGEPPWVFVNKLLKLAGLDYKFTYPKGAATDAPFDALLEGPTGLTLRVSSLSGGEKVLISLALAIYNASRDLHLPELILLDEPDASLHPSMAQIFLKVISENLVRDKNIHVILTTHSPSTVAMAPEESIYLMVKPNGMLEKTSKDLALKALTLGVPSLSIHYENRRQVFVESWMDLELYEMAFQYLSSRLASEIDLNFIASGTEGAGSSSQVKTIVEDLREKGVKTVFGIVDWDLANSETDFVKVISLGKRYSIENLIFDPICLGGFLLAQLLIEKKDCGLSSSESFVDLRDKDDQALQICSDHVVTKLAPHLPGFSPQPTTTVTYANGRQVKIPECILRMRGHDLEDALKTALPALKRFKNANQLKKTVLKNTFESLPSLVPLDFLEIFEKLQKV